MVQVIQPRNILGEVGQAIGGGLGQAFQYQTQRNQISQALNALNEMDPNATPYQRALGLVRALGGTPAENQIGPLLQLAQREAMAEAFSEQGAVGDVANVPVLTPEISTGGTVPQMQPGQPPMQMPASGQVGAIPQELANPSGEAAMGARQQRVAQPFSVPRPDYYRQKHQKAIRINPQLGLQMAEQDRRADMEALQEQRAQAQESRLQEQYSRNVGAEQNLKLDNMIDRTLNELAMPYKENIGRFSKRKMAEYLSDPANAKLSEEQILGKVGRDVENVVNRITAIQKNLGAGRITDFFTGDYKRRAEMAKKQIQELWKDTGDESFARELKQSARELGATETESLNIAYPSNEKIRSELDRFARQEGKKIASENEFAAFGQAGANPEKYFRKSKIAQNLIANWDNTTNPNQIKRQLVQGVGLTDEQADEILQKVADEVRLTDEQKIWHAESMERAAVQPWEIVTRFFEFFKPRV